MQQWTKSTRCFFFSCFKTEANGKRETISGIGQDGELQLSSVEFSKRSILPNSDRDQNRFRSNGKTSTAAESVIIFLASNEAGRQAGQHTGGGADVHGARERGGNKGERSDGRRDGRGGDRGDSKSLLDDVISHSRAINGLAVRRQDLGLNFLALDFFYGNRAGLDPSKRKSYIK